MKEIQKGSTVSFQVKHVGKVLGLRGGNAIVQFVGEENAKSVPISRLSVVNYDPAAIALNIVTIELFLTNVVSGLVQMGVAKMIECKDGTCSLVRVGSKGRYLPESKAVLRSKVMEHEGEVTFACSMSTNPSMEDAIALKKPILECKEVIKWMLSSEKYMVYVKDNSEAFAYLSGEIVKAKLIFNAITKLEI